MGQFSFEDIFKKSFLSSESLVTLNVLGVIETLIMAFLAGLIIMFVYKTAFRGVVYSKSFNTSLLMMTVITAMIIMTISSNIILSLGMVGALSIVRYRTAIKDPMDLAFLFWSVGAGIGIGAGIYTIAFLGSLTMGLMLIILNLFRDKKKIFLLVINHEDIAAPDVKLALSRLKSNIKSKTVVKGTTELTVEIKLKDSNTAFVNEIAKIDGVKNAVLVSYNGDFAE